MSEMSDDKQNELITFIKTLINLDDKLISSDEKVEIINKINKNYENRENKIVDESPTIIEQLKKEKNFNWVGSGRFRNYVTDFSFNANTKHGEIKLTFHIIDRKESLIRFSIEHDNITIYNKKQQRFDEKRNPINSEPGMFPGEFKWSTINYSIDPKLPIKTISEIVEEVEHFEIKYKDLLFEPFLEETGTDNEKIIKKMKELLKNIN